MALIDIWNINRYICKVLHSARIIITLKNTALMRFPHISCINVFSIWSKQPYYIFFQLFFLLVYIWNFVIFICFFSYILISKWLKFCHFFYFSLYFTIKMFKIMSFFIYFTIFSPIFYLKIIRILSFFMYFFIVFHIFTLRICPLNLQFTLY